jgi:4-hydroxybenzoate polyprenyltransferase
MEGAAGGRTSPVLALARACHPEPTVAVTTITTAMAVAAGRGWGSVWVAAAVLCGQLSVGWANDYLDRRLDLAAGRRDKPIAAGQVEADVVAHAAVVALVLAIVLSLVSGVLATAVHGFALLMAHLYNLALKYSPFSVVPYFCAFAMVPAFVSLGLRSPHLPLWWVMAGAGLLGAGAHFTQVLPDLAGDELTGVRGLPQRLGYAGSVIAATGLIAAGALVAGLGRGLAFSGAALPALAVCMALVVLVAVAALLGRPTAAFRLTILAAGAALMTFVLAGGARL